MWKIFQWNMHELQCLNSLKKNVVNKCYAWVYHFFFYTFFKLKLLIMPQCLINWLFLLFIRLKKRHLRRKIMIKRNPGRNTIIVVQSIKSIHHPDNSQSWKMSLPKGKKGRLIDTRIQTMMSIQVQKMNLVKWKANVVRIATRALSIESSHPRACLAGILQKIMVKIVWREIIACQNGKHFLQKVGQIMML